LAGLTCEVACCLLTAGRLTRPLVGALAAADTFFDAPLAAELLGFAAAAPLAVTFSFAGGFLATILEASH